jgi:hypothetical protein
LATIRELLPNADHVAENAEVERMEIEDVSDVIPLPERWSCWRRCRLTPGR